MEKILIIEDDDSIREMLQQILEFEGFSVETAIHGQAALEILESHPLPSLILLDLMMPVLNGWEFMKIKQERHSIREIPVIIISAFTERAQDIKCEGVLGKPIQLDKLLELIGRFHGDFHAA